MFLKVKNKKRFSIKLKFYFKELRQCLLNYDSSNHCTTTMTLNSASELTNHSEDEQILDLQNRLQSAKNIQVRKKQFS
jgi:hypothetical protein